MRALGFAIVTLIAWLGLATPAMAQAPDPYSKGPHIALKLIAESDTPAAGKTVTIAYDATPQPGWHGYWQNPGDAGFPAKLDWKLPAGVTVGTPRYPVPTTLLIAGLMNYVFEQHYTLLIDLNVPAGLAAGTKLPVKLKTQYLVCTEEICQPEAAELSLDLTVGDGTITPDRLAQFDRYRQAIPKPIGMATSYQIDGKQLRIGVPYPAAAPLDQAYFFPATPDRLNYAAPQKVVRDGDRLVITTEVLKADGGPIDGILRIGAQKAVSLSASAGAVPPASGASGQSAGAENGVLVATLIALGGAMLGGLILNIMPCVFPILSLKALSLAKGSVDEKEARREALAYTAGVLTVIMGLGATILALRAGGAAVGWAFQLQSPGTIVVLLMLVVALTLNLAGLFEIPTPAFVDSASGASGAFATGALAAIIATPCTGPFMGAALGAALVLPTAAAMAVFFGLGFGLAIPFLAIGFVPALRKALPKPGTWMETFRQVLAVPMGLTAIWLAWVLGGEAGVDGITLGLVGALGVAVVLFIVGKRQHQGLSAHWLSLVALVAVTGATAYAIRPVPKGANAASALVAEGKAAFSEEKLAEARAKGQPVFAYFTADWCLTCKVNERIAIDTDQVKAAFAKHNVAVMVGDWTDGDPKLGRFIEAHNRAGVPLYLFYKPGAKEPEVLPQVLTPAMLSELAGG
ncbi:thioredoxin family protein [Sphingomonas sp. CCH10-B3]|uniref:protein-disulfide reductase DsbD family protein n=1 Tax=Sphingomonas sp. CCH10-B3 TaxID=1768757 RepID=UPI0008300159|nr:thioredoxin family protein [Sphingomonas sp. CCH10-B3]